MNAKIFLDANIVLDLFIKRSSYPFVRALFEEIIKGHLQAFVTPTAVHICSYWLTKTYGSPKARELLLQLLNDVAVIETSPRVVFTAITSSFSDVEDALKYFTALEHRLQFFITEDKKIKKFAVAALPVYTTEAFLKFIAQ